MIRLYLYIAIGGVLGSISRFGVSQLLKQWTTNFPYGTFFVNIAGCLLIGLLYTFLNNYNSLSQEIRYIGIIGFCGSFTTFSSFAYENIILIEKGDYLTFSLYFIMSCLIGLASVLIGLKAS